MSPKKSKILHFEFVFRVRSVTHKHLQKMYENTFDKIFNQQIGMYLCIEIFSF
jgi:hypothetical protein